MTGILRLLGVVLLCLAVLPMAALADCATPADPIDTDRPDTPDDSPAVPPGSLQFENGFGLSRSGGVTSLDLPETRIRLGLASCTEFLVDLPNYNRTLDHGPRGFGDIAPGLKYQLDDLPDWAGLWLVGGVALPTGNQQIAGRGAQPYLQIPASVDVTDKLTVAVQYVATFHPGDFDTTTEHQTSLDLEFEVSEDFGVFSEYTGTFRRGAVSQHTADLGAVYRLSETRAVDFMVGRGLNSAAPDWYFTVGYSFRFDRLF